MKKRLLWGAAVIVAALAALGLRVVLEGRAALAEGDAAIADKRPADNKKGWSVEVDKHDFPLAMQLLEARGLPSAPLLHAIASKRACTSG